MKRYIAILTLLASSFAAFLLCFSTEPEKEQITSAKTARVEVVTITPQTVQQQVTSHGKIKPRWQSKLTAEVEGEILFISPKLLAGNSFQKGELLLSIEPSEYILQLRQAEANLSSCKRQLLEEQERARVAQENWSLSGFTSKANELTLHIPQLTEAKAKYEAALAKQQRAAYKLSKCKLHAPYDGVSLNRQINPGESLQIGSKIATIYKKDELEIALPLSRKKMGQLGKIQRGTQVILKQAPQAIATIARVEQQVDPKSQWQKIIIATKAHLLPGSFFTVTIPGAKQKKVFTIGEQFLSKRGELWLVDRENKLQAITPNILFQQKGLLYFTLTKEHKKLSLTRPKDFFLSGILVTPFSK